MAQYSITKALNELKLLDARISTAITQGKFTGFQIGKNLIDGQVDVVTFTNRAKESLQSVQALIKRRNEVKSKIVASNAVTKVTIAGVEMTVAEAIDRKTSIAYEKALLNALRIQYQQATSKAQQSNNQVKLQLDKNIEIMLGKDLTNKAAEVEAMTKSFNELNGAVVIDPLNIFKLITDLHKSIEDFENEVDFSLSESNVRNAIELAD